VEAILYPRKVQLMTIFGYIVISVLVIGFIAWRVANFNAAKARGEYNLTAAERDARINEALLRARRHGQAKARAQARVEAERAYYGPRAAMVIAANNRRNGR
jgi:hypothetical protein